MLTQPNDTVLDIFAGSNTTGAVADSLERKWVAFELSHEYLITSSFRFLENVELNTVRQVVTRLTDSLAALTLPINSAPQLSLINS
jgi:site-specific DNA-methyltransferase (cytosine-N4-specific)